ncbi:hypothetical protein [Streptomyces sp. NPDC047108]|uniref:hypothetical protein n=1 Tax=Streptomyces sp. NPDC047108 TaxID=3155025 RepID=UPI0033FE121F
MNGSSLARQLPLRLSAGAFLLNSGLSKSSADEETAQQLQGFAAGTYPFLGKLDARSFLGLLSKAEVTIGAALLLPVVPAAVAGAALTAFSVGTLGLYLKTPGMRREGSLRWTEQGLPLAKDAWMLGMGVSLLIDGLPKPGGGRRCR